jgi:hypothetical protein
MAAQSDVEEQLRELARTLEDARRSIGRSFGDIINENRASYTAANRLTQDAAGGLNQALQTVLKNVPLLGTAIQAFFKTEAAAASYLAQEADRTVQAYRELGQVGGIGAKNLEGLSDQFLASGMTLGAFTKAVVTNANDLARMSGSVAKGATAFSDAAGKLVADDQIRGDELRKLGINADAMGEGLASYIRLQNTLGRGQQQSTEQLAKGARDYLVEMDGLARATGLQRKDLEKQREEMLRQTQFLAVIRDLERKGQGDRAKQLLMYAQRMMAVDQELGQGAMDVARGVTDTDAAIKFLNSSAGRALDVNDQIINQGLDSVSAMKQMQEGFIQTSDDAINMGLSMGRGADQYRVGLSAATKMENLNIANLKDLTDEQIAAMMATGDLTNAHVKNEKNLEDLNRTMTGLGQLGLPLFAQAINTATTSLKNLVVALGSEIKGLEKLPVMQNERQRQEKQAIEDQKKAEEHRKKNPQYNIIPPPGEKTLEERLKERERLRNEQKEKQQQGGQPFNQGLASADLDQMVKQLGTGGVGPVSRVVEAAQRGEINPASIFASVAGMGGSGMPNMLTKVLSAPSRPFNASLNTDVTKNFGLGMGEAARQYNVPSQQTSQDEMAIMMAQNANLTELVNLMKNSVNVQTKIAQNTY